MKKKIKQGRRTQDTKHQMNGSVPVALEVSDGGQQQQHPHHEQQQQQMRNASSAPPPDGAVGGGSPSSSTFGIPIATVPHPVVSGFGGEKNGDASASTSTKHKTKKDSPSSVFLSRSHLSSRSNSFASSAGLYDEPSSPGGGGDGDGVGRGSGSSDGGEGTGAGSSSSGGVGLRGLDDLLRESVLSFHREGPLVNPLEGQKAHAITGWHNKSGGSTIKDKMQFVAEVKGFDYGIFWKHAREKKCFAYHGSVLITSNVVGGGGGAGNATSSPGSSSTVPASLEGAGGQSVVDGLSLFIQSSMTMFTTWIMGFGMAGRVGYTGNYEWHEEVTSLPGWSFQRLRQAKNAELRTVIGVPVAGGVVEFGSTRLHPHNLLTVQYVQKLMGEPQAALNN